MISSARATRHPYAADSRDRKSAATGFVADALAAGGRDDAGQAANAQQHGQRDRGGDPKATETGPCDAPPGDPSIPRGTRTQVSLRLVGTPPCAGRDRSASLAGRRPRRTGEAERRSSVHGQQGCEPLGRGQSPCMPGAAIPARRRRPCRGRPSTQPNRPTYAALANVSGSRSIRSAWTQRCRS